jgi:hypothetical protein
MMDVGRLGMRIIAVVAVEVVVCTLVSLVAPLVAEGEVGDVLPG